MILYTFFEDYDLFNKTITLFCPSGESRLLDTEKTIQVDSGKRIARFKVSIKRGFKRCKRMGK